MNTRLLFVKIIGIMLVIFAAVVAVLGLNVYTARRVKRTVRETQQIVNIRREVNQLLTWSTDYALTFKANSEKQTEMTAKQLQALLAELNAQYRHDPIMREKLRGIDRLFVEFQALGSEMAHAYIHYDRVVGNSYIDRYYDSRDRLVRATSELIDIVEKKMWSVLDFSIISSIIAATSIILLIALPLCLAFHSNVTRVQASITFLNKSGEDHPTRNLIVDSKEDFSRLAAWFSGKPWDREA